MCMCRGACQLTDLERRVVLLQGKTRFLPNRFAGAVDLRAHGCAVAATLLLAPRQWLHGAQTRHS